MLTVTANEAKIHFGEMLKEARQRPILVMRRARLAGVIIAPEDYAILQKLYAWRLENGQDEAAPALMQVFTGEELARLRLLCQSETGPPAPVRQDAIAGLCASPLVAPDFHPLSRDEAHER